MRLYYDFIDVSWAKLYNLKIRYCCLFYNKHSNFDHRILKNLAKFFKSEIFETMFSVTYKLKTGRKSVQATLYQAFRELFYCAFGSELCCQASLLLIFIPADGVFKQLEFHYICFYYLSICNFTTFYSNLSFKLMSSFFEYNTAWLRKEWLNLGDCVSSLINWLHLLIQKNWFFWQSFTKLSYLSMCRKI